MIDLVTNKDIIRMNKVRNMTKDFLDKKELEYYKNKDKETEKKIKEIIKDINSRKTYYEKARKAHKKDKDISSICFCVGLLSQCDRDLELIKQIFPDYFKESN